MHRADRYATDKRLYPMQTEAQANRRGLWADPAPVPPKIGKIAAEVFVVHVLTLNGGVSENGI